jgi:hypothetical protein
MRAGKAIGGFQQQEQATEAGKMIRNFIVNLALASVLIAIPGTALRAQSKDAENVRGQITRIEDATIEVKTASGKTVTLATNAATTIFALWQCGMSATARSCAIR